MKIAIEAQRIFRKKKHGMDIVALELIRKLQQIDHKNEYFILVKKDRDNKVLSETKNFHIIELPSAPYPVWEQYHLPKVVKKIRPDILHCTSNTAPLWMEVPLVLTLHDIIFMRKIGLIQGTWYQKMGNLYRKWNVPKVIKRCQKVITVSDFEKRNISDFFSVKPDEIETIYNAYSSHFIPIKDKEKLNLFREQYHLPQKFILFLGNTDPKKNTFTVLKAFNLIHQKMKGDIFLVMPDINRAHLKKFLHKISNPALEKSICYLPYMPNEDLVYLYNLATIFLYPSLYESFGIPILEAMACGTPVITSSRAAMPEIAGKGALFVNPDKERDLADAILRLFSEKGLIQSYRKAGLDRVSFFDWTLTAFGVLDVYYQIFQRSRTLNVQYQ